MKDLAEYVVVAAISFATLALTYSYFGAQLTDLLTASFSLLPQW